MSASDNPIVISSSGKWPKRDSRRISATSMSTPSTIPNSSVASTASQNGAPAPATEMPTYVATRPISAIAKLGTSAAFITTTMASPSRANQLPDSRPLTIVCSTATSDRHCGCHCGPVKGCSTVHLPPANFAMPACTAQVWPSGSGPHSMSGMEPSLIGFDFSPSAVLVKFA